MVLKTEQERVKTLLKDTITLLCKNGLSFQTKFSIEALIGVTLDDNEVMLFSINELVKARHATNTDHEEMGEDSDTARARKRQQKRHQHATNTDHEEMGEDSDTTQTRKRKRKRPHVRYDIDTSMAATQDDQTMQDAQSNSADFDSADQEFESSNVESQTPTKKHVIVKEEDIIVIKGEVEDNDSWPEMAPYSDSQFSDSAKNQAPGAYSMSGSNNQAQEAYSIPGSSQDRAWSASVLPPGDQENYSGATDSVDTHSQSVMNSCSKRRLLTKEGDHHQGTLTMENTYQGFGKNECGQPNFVTSPFEHCSAEHSRSHKVHQCDYCGQTFTFKHDLEGHKARHTGVKEFRCICEKEFAYRSTFKRHQKLCPLLRYPNSST